MAGKSRLRAVSRSNRGGGVAQKHVDLPIAQGVEAFTCAEGNEIDAPGIIEDGSGNRAAIGHVEAAPEAILALFGKTGQARIDPATERAALAHLD